MVVGKFLAAYLMFFSTMTFNSLYFIVLNRYAQLKFTVLFGNLVAILLVGMVFIAIGLFVSSLTENQLAAAIGTIAIIVAFLLVGLLSSLFPSSYPVRYVFNFISIFTRFQGFSNGYFDLASIFYYLTVAFVFLYLTVRVFDRRRYN
jgi:ABC-2 type transport system permease protein